MSTYPSTIAVSGGTWGSFNYIYVSTDPGGTEFLYRTEYFPPNDTTAPNTGTFTDISFSTTDNKWTDVGSGAPGAFLNITQEGTSGGSNPSVACSLGETIKLQNSPGSGNRGSFTHPEIISGSGSGSGGGGSGGVQTLSGGSSSEIINVQFTKLTDTSIELGFDWQNISNYTVFVDRGGTVTNSSPSVTGSSGTITGYTGAGAHALTGLNEGDKVWVANAFDAYGNLPVHTHYIIDWSYNKVTKKVVAKAFFQDNGGNGFGQSADVALARLSGSTWSTGYSLSEAVADPTNGYVNYDGTLKTLTLDAKRGTRWGVSNIDASQYGSIFRIPSLASSANFW